MRILNASEMNFAGTRDEPRDFFAELKRPNIGFVLPAVRLLMLSNDTSAVKRSGWN